MKYSINQNTATINGCDIAIDNIVFIDYLGKGANSIVFRGYDELLDRYLAIKIWIYKSNDGRDKYKQALMEAQKIASLRHPNIVNIFRANSHHKTTISLEMEFIEGKALRDYLESEYTNIDLLKKIWNQLFDAMSYSYCQGIYHGDLHDRNILLVGDSDIRIIDFGTSLFALNDIDLKKRDTRLLLRLFKKMFGEEYSLLIDNQELIFDKPEVVLNITKTILNIFYFITTLGYYSAENKQLLAESYAGNISACIASCPFINISNIILSIRNKKIDEHYINVFLNGCINLLELELSNKRKVDGYICDETSIDNLVVKVNELLVEARCLHELIYREDSRNYITNV